MAGVDDLLADVPEADRLGRGGIADAGTGVWADAGVESNGDPLGKLADFQSQMADLCGKVDIAFMKFCWADTNYLEGTGGGSPQALLDHYKATMAAVHTACPSVTLVHFTMPLMDGGNEVREEYNDLVRAEYGTAVFDLAREESTLSDGTRCRDGGVPILCAAYTSDGGHPDTDAGKRRVAARLIEFLASL